MPKSKFKADDAVEMDSCGRTYKGKVQAVDDVHTTVKFGNGNVVPITNHLADNVLKKVK